MNAPLPSASPITQPHITNADLIRAVLDGKKVRMRHTSALGNPPGQWVTAEGRSALYYLIDIQHQYEFELAPEPVVLYARVFKTLVINGTSQPASVVFDYSLTNRDACVKSGKADKILCVAIDPTTWEVKATIEDV